MTNAEKYKEIFGLFVDPSMCPSHDCIECPCHNKKEDPDFCFGGSTYEWWNSEYKEVLNNVN